MSERQPTSIRRITDEIEPVALERQVGPSAAAAANVAAPLLMVVLLYVAFKAYLSFVTHAPESYTAASAVGLRGYFQGELSLLLTPLQTSLVTALVSAARGLYPQRLPFYFAGALVLTELRRKSSSVIPCIVASCVAGALGLFVLLPAP